MTSYSVALAVSYAIAMAAWALLVRAVPHLWPRVQLSFERPWREVGWAVLAVVAVVLLGQLYVAGIRLRGTAGWRPLTETINQLVIFSPILALPRLRRHEYTTAWIRRDRIWLRLTIGILLSLGAVACFTALHGSVAWWAAVVRIYRPSSLHIAAQVLFEDIAIAVLVVRLAAALGTVGAVVLAAVLFAAGHIPTLIANGATPTELLGLVRDAVLGAAVIGVAIRAADLWVLWPIHFALDMMQFVTSGRIP